MKIQSNNVLFKPDVAPYSVELKILVQCFNNFVLHHALTASFEIPMKWLSLAYFIAVYNKDHDLIMF